MLQRDYSIPKVISASAVGTMIDFIQITATLGLFLSLAVILIVQNQMSAEAFRSWGWRIPFLISIGLVAVSLYIRLRRSRRSLRRSRAPA